MDADMQICEMYFMTYMIRLALLFSVSCTGVTVYLVFILPGEGLRCAGGVPESPVRRGENIQTTPLIDPSHVSVNSFRRGLNTIPHGDAANCC